MARYKHAAEITVKEYFDSEDVGEVIRCLEEMDHGLDEPPLHLFVKRCVSLAMDRGPRECELVSRLLKDLRFAGKIGAREIREGFVLLLDTADDLTLDIPDASDMLALFVARAVVDGVLAASFLEDTVHTLPDRCCGLDIIAASSYMLAAPRGGHAIADCWASTAAARGGSRKGPKTGGIGVR